MITCANCRTENPAGAKFCTECASPLARPCPNCGTANPAGAKFCSECATPLADGAAPATGQSPVAPPPGAAPVAERRVVSILFADLVGFTPFAEERDAEAVRESLSQYFELARQIVGRYGGTVEKFIGDAVMAVWGVPTAHEDDAERAVRAGLDLVEAVPSLGEGIQARAGVLTGEAAVTLGATDQGMVAGDLVNTASRLQSAAPPGTLLVGEATQRAASAGITFEEAGAQLLKGKSAPVAAWRAVRVAGGIRGRWRTEGPEAPFVGRTEELALLRDMYHATGREGRARLVSVVGPAGIGKSRLAREFLSHVDAEADDFWLHHGRSPAYGDGLTFWALGEMIRQRAGLLETDDEATTRERVASMVAEHVPDDADRRWIEPSMLSLLGVPGVVVETEQLFGAWRTFFERLAADVPVALVFEDLHWADSGMLDFIDYLLEWSRNQPIFILTLARPELLERRPNWGAGKRQFTSLYLEPLPEPAIRELLLGLVPGLPDTAARAIAARADGIPLYAVETVRMLVADGRLVEEGGSYRPSGDLGDLAVPESLTALIASRLDALEPDVRALAQDASVLGQRFTLSGLSAVSGLAGDELERRVDVLVRRDLFNREADPRSPELNQYGFVQSLIREVAYNTLARRDRKVRHLAAARFMEGVETDELAGALAGQYAAAHSNADDPEEQAALAAQAKLALKAAADRAATLGAPDQAYGFYAKALDMAGDSPDGAEIALRAGQTASAAGHYQEGERLLRESIDRFTAAGQEAEADRAIAALASNLIDAVRFQEAITLLEPLVGEGADLASRPALIAAGGQLARVLMLSLKTDRAVNVADRILPAAEKADRPVELADLLVTKGTALGIIGRVREGIALIKAGRDMAEAEEATLVVLRALGNQAGSQEWFSVREALDASREALTLGRRIGHRSSVLTAVANAILGAISTGEWESADAELVRTQPEDFDGYDRLLVTVLRAQLLALRGEERAALMTEAEEFGETEALVQVEIDRAAAFNAIAEGRLEVARTRFAAGVATQQAFLETTMLHHVGVWLRDPKLVRDDARDFAESGVHGHTAEIEALTLAAAQAGLAGETEESLRLYRRALTGWQDEGLAFIHALAVIDMATVLDPTLPEVADAIGVARETLARLRAAPYLARLDAVAGDSAPARTSASDAVPVARAEVPIS